MTESAFPIDDAISELETAFDKTLGPATRAAWNKRFDKFHPAAFVRALRKIRDNEDRFPSLAMVLRYYRTEVPQAGVPQHREGEDVNGVPCWFWGDEPNVPAYSAKDCPEGREALAALASIAKLKALSPGQVRERQAGTVDCPDCGQRYPVEAFLEHICLSPRTRAERRLAPPEREPGQEG